MGVLDGDQGIYNSDGKTRITQYDITEKIQPNTHLNYHSTNCMTAYGSDGTQYFRIRLNQMQWYWDGGAQTAPTNTGLYYAPPTTMTYRSNYPYFAVDVFVKDANGTYHYIQQLTDWMNDSNIMTISEIQAAGLPLATITAEDGTTAYGDFYYKTNYRYPCTMNVPEYLANGESLYFSHRLCINGVSSGKYKYYEANGSRTYQKYYDDAFGANKDDMDAKCVRQYTMGASTISYPSFCPSNRAKVSVAKCLNSNKAEVYESTNNGSTWTKIKTVQAEGFDDATSWSISTVDQGEVTAIFRIGKSVGAITIDASSNTTTKKYKVIHYGKTTTQEKVGSTTLDILNMATPSDVILNESNTSGGSFTITKSTVDLSRVAFAEYFESTLQPQTTQQGVSGKTTYNTQVSANPYQYLLQSGKTVITTANGKFKYSILPRLDNTYSYDNGAAGAVVMYYQKAITQLEMIRPIEMGSTMPKKISLLTNPGKTSFPSGSNVKFYVANNGNDDNIIWEELPYTCLGTPANPDCDTYEFSNTEKTANTWKIMIKVVADKGTATSDFQLLSFSAVINGGRAGENALVACDTVTLDTTATSVQLQMPTDYNKIKIIGNVINTNQSGNLKILVNNKTSGYDTYTQYFYSTTIKTASATAHAGLLGSNSNVGKCPQFEMTLFNYGSKWYIVSDCYTDTGVTFNHSMIDVTDGLEYITLTTLSNSYPMQPGTEFTIMGVK